MLGTGRKGVVSKPSKHHVIDKLWCARRLCADLQVTPHLWGDSCWKRYGEGTAGLLQNCFHSREVQIEILQFSLKLKKGCGTGLVVDGLETVNSERLLIATHQALLMESDIQKETYFSKEGVVKWQNSLAEDAVEARSTERLRKSGKRTRTAVDVEHNDVNRFFFSAPEVLRLLTAWGGGQLEKRLLCIWHISFNFCLRGKW